MRLPHLGPTAMPDALILGERRDELAVEVGDVGHDAAPDRVRGGLEASEYASNGTLGRSQGSPFSGWCDCWCGGTRPARWRNRTRCYRLLASSRKLGQPRARCSERWLDLMATLYEGVVTLRLNS